MRIDAIFTDPTDSLYIWLRFNYYIYLDFSRFFV